jgi:hypothetical protein
VGKTATIQNDKFDAIDSGLLHPVDEFMFGIALKAGELMSKPLGYLNTATLNLAKTHRAIDLRFARTEQV